MHYHGLRHGLILGSLLLATGLAGCQVNTTAASTADTVATANAVTATTNASGAASGTPATPVTLATADYAELLITYVNDQAMVDYGALQQNRQGLDRYNASLASVPPSQFESWSEPEQIAFLINAYNSLTLASIIDQTPIKASIKDINGVWRGRKHGIASETKTLDEIEHETLRVDYNEPRIHAALVCAAMSCPPLRKEPYSGEQLEAQLDEQVKIWLASPEIGLRIDREANKVYLSSIFKWFGEDWLPDYGTDSGFAGNEKERAVLNFVSNYVSPEDKAYLEAGGYGLDYLDYDWALNQS
ncbi:MAG: DUF547 domain-containing protein [Synechococcales cyanobacterium RM1_1_8]|nr:DUF547 domain-containing protein [Synechococcales cyanobacterium RM1_1_8]